MQAGSIKGRACGRDGRSWFPPGKKGLGAYPLTGVVRGQGRYKGRGVVVWEASEDLTVGGEAVEIRGYGLIDLDTGMWLHFESSSRFI
jgi:hypothetical protein